LDARGFFFQPQLSVAIFLALGLLRYAGIVFAVMGRVVKIAPAFSEPKGDGS